MREKRGEIGLEAAKMCFLQKNMYLYTNTRYNKGSLAAASRAHEEDRFDFFAAARVIFAAATSLWILGSLHFSLQ